MTISADFDHLVGEAEPALTNPADWRDDPRWKLCAWDSEAFPEQPSDRPVARAELAQPADWCSLYDGSRIIATWYRGPAE